jgi:hypothetical protein
MESTKYTRKILISHFKKFNFSLLEDPYFEICNIQDNLNSEEFKLKADGLSKLGFNNQDYGELATLFSFWERNELGSMTGLFHYRRFLTFDSNSLDGSEVSNKFWEGNYRSSWLKRKQFADSQLISLKNFDNKLVLPTPRIILNGQNIWQDFVTVHPNLKEIFDKICLIWDKKFPNSNIKKWFNHNSKMYLFNMFYAPKSFVNQWCESLFPILIEVDKEFRKENRTNISRWGGYVSERLFSFYVNQAFITENYELVQVPVMHFKELDHEAQLNNLLLQLRNAEKEIDGFVNSKSWKLTEPLRQISKFIT